MEKSAESLAHQQRVGQSSTDSDQLVTSSRFFSNEFNTAIIDGPLRIYFSDRQEAGALQIYFQIQEIMNMSGLTLGSISVQNPNMFLMLYPDREVFMKIFEQEVDVAFGKFGRHLVLGVNGPIEEETRKLICHQVRTIFAEAQAQARA